MSYWTKRRKIASLVDQHLRYIAECQYDNQQLAEQCEIVPDTSSSASASASNTFDNLFVAQRHSQYEHSQDGPDLDASVDIHEVDTEVFEGPNSVTDQSDLSDGSDSHSDSHQLYDENENLGMELSNWAMKSNVSHSSLGELLQILVKYHPSLPKDPRTLLSTQKIIELKTIPGGFYYHFGIANGILMRSSHLKQLKHDSINLQINVDGLPLFKSSSEQFWPILGMIREESCTCKPFVIGLYSGKTKPTSPEDFLCDFVDEMMHLTETGIHYCGRIFRVSISAFLCDAPARAYVKQVNSHSGYSSCEKCTVKGEYDCKVYFPDVDAQLRTDDSFRNKLDREHHIGTSPLDQLNISLVSQFPLDYMHMVCLGVMRRLLALWIKGPLKTRLGRQVRMEISQSLLSLRPFIPQEFARKPRSFDEVDRWKATEFRLFLLYTGPVVLKNKLPEPLYDNFMLLSTAMNILASPVLCKPLCGYAKELLVNFVQHFSSLYGANQVVYNVHCLIHIPDDVRLHGPLDMFSCFPFENFLQYLKKLVRKPNFVLKQVVLRLLERSTHLVEDCQCLSELTDFTLKAQHSKGPLPQGTMYVPCTEFRDAVFCDCVISSKSGDNCVKVGSHFAVIKNIIQSKGGIFIVYRKYCCSGSFFMYPINSQQCDVYKLSELSEDVHVASIQSVRGKYMLLPYRNEHVAIPILHLRNNSLA